MVKSLFLCYGCWPVESQLESKSVKIGKRGMLRMLVALLPTKSRIHNGSKIEKITVKMWEISKELC